MSKGCLGLLGAAGASCEQADVTSADEGCELNRLVDGVHRLGLSAGHRHQSEVAVAFAEGGIEADQFESGLVERGTHHRGLERKRLMALDGVEAGLGRSLNRIWQGPVSPKESEIGRKGRRRHGTTVRHRRR